MDNKVCLTKRQAQYYNYFTRYFEKHGMFPAIATASREMGKPPASILCAFGSLFLKGAFNDGIPLTNTYIASHVNVKANSIDLSKSKATVQKRAAKKPVQAQKPKVNAKTAKSATEHSDIVKSLLEALEGFRKAS